MISRIAKALIVVLVTGALMGSECFFFTAEALGNLSDVVVN